MKLDTDGCVICGSTWGDVWAEVQGERLFFCCEICVEQFRGLLHRIYDITGWDRVDALHIEGDRRGRFVRAERGTDVFRGFVAFNSLGQVREFHVLSPSDDSSASPASG